MKQFDYQQAFGAWDKTSDAMKNALKRWQQLYYDHNATEKKDPCQRIAYTVVQKLVRGVFGEYQSACPKGIYRQILKDLESQKEKAVQLALISGTCFIKPWPKENGFGFSLIPRQNVLVFGRDSDGNITDMGMVERSVRDRWYYSLLERRYVDDKGFLTIENKLYRSLNSETLGAQVPLSDHPLYEGLPVRYTFPECLGGVGLISVKTPMFNCVDGSFDGVSVYAAAADLIDRIDENEAQLAEEFRRGESRIITSRDLLDDNDRLTEHLFVGLDEDPEQVGFHIFAPALREQSFLNRKQEYLRNVESVIGLQRGMLSDVNMQDRTATEVSASGGEYNLTVMDFQKMWEDAMHKTMELCSVLGHIYGITSGKLPQITADWGNGVLYDEEKSWEDYKDMVARGLIAPEVALAWRFGMSAETPEERKSIREKLMPQ